MKAASNKVLKIDDQKPFQSGYSKIQPTSILLHEQLLVLLKLMI